MSTKSKDYNIQSYTIVITAERELAFIIWMKSKTKTCYSNIYFFPIGQRMVSQKSVVDMAHIKSSITSLSKQLRYMERMTAELGDFVIGDKLPNVLIDESMPA